ncbi:hypothetical protein B0H63DRAFT_443176 [Podospora didyma]|uniref:Uncharacterized protein n=1 Tax=Podospora didyma TaxID=330526 RepID=A0AAE0P3Z5_9PEZI|nr:hypothetical protein B0H63DRAFT_443176 [Podospora didyma]
MPVTTRKRARTFEPAYDGNADDEAHSKGGHSLRKRTRVDYTQEQIDDHNGSAAGFHALPAPKPAATPSVRGGRKRKIAQQDSEQEQDSFPVVQPKRRRADKSPAATARGGGPARKRPAKKQTPAPPVRTYNDQPSDNEVQDTILVGLPMSLAFDNGSSDRSSSPVSEESPSSSDGSNAAPAEAQPPTPQPQVGLVPQIEAAAFGSENEDAIEKQLISEPDEGKHSLDIQPTSLSFSPHLDGNKESNLPAALHQSAQPIEAEKLAPNVETSPTLSQPTRLLPTQSTKRTTEKPLASKTMAPAAAVVTEDEPEPASAALDVPAIVIGKAIVTSPEDSANAPMASSQSIASREELISAPIDTPTVTAPEEPAVTPSDMPNIPQPKVFAAASTDEVIAAPEEQLMPSLDNTTAVASVGESTEPNATPLNLVTEPAATVAVESDDTADTAAELAVTTAVESVSVDLAAEEAPQGDAITQEHSELGAVHDAMPEAADSPEPQAVFETLDSSASEKPHPETKEEPQIQTTEPHVDKLVASGPVISEPVAVSPALDEVKVDEPAVDNTAVDEEMHDAPVVDELVVDELAAQQPAVEQPEVELPVDESPAAIPAVVEPAIAEQTVDELEVIKPAVAESAVIEQTVTEPEAIKPPVVDPAVAEQAADEPTVVESATVESAAVEQALPEPVPSEIAASPLVASEPATSEPVISKPIPSETVVSEPAPITETVPELHLPELAKDSSTPSITKTESTAESDAQKPVQSVAPFTQPPRDQKPSQPARLPTLERIFTKETPYASQLNLTPYEDEEISYPAPSIEWVHPGDKNREATPAITPTPTPSPVEPSEVEIKWDLSRPPTRRRFYTWYQQDTKRRQERGLPRISMIEFNNEVVRKYKAAQKAGGHDTSSAQLTPVSDRPDVTVKKVQKRSAVAPTHSFDETPRSSQAPESQQPTAAPSPAAAEGEITLGQVDVGDEEQEDEEVADGDVKSGSPAEPVEVTRNPHKQYSFPKLRDPSEYAEALEKAVGEGGRWAVAAAIVEAMDKYQAEYHELKKITDDEENAKRRQANDKTIINWENRQKNDEPLPQRRHFDDFVKGPPPFEVRGARAPKPYIDDPALEHQRKEDRIMAQVYGFKHNNHPTQVGRQNPEDQRWEMPETRLRERKRTEKAAELAEENVIDGKRQRKPRNISDQSKDPSRSGTPMPPLGLHVRRQRRKFGDTAANGDDGDGADYVPPSSDNVPEPPVKKRRGPKPKAEKLAEALRKAQILEAETPQQDQTRTDDDGDFDDKAKVVRKRARAAAGAGWSNLSTVETDKSKAPKPQGARTQPSSEIASSSFYSNPSTTDTRGEGEANGEGAGSRPSTASSQATVNTAETMESTTYSLREKPKRNYALENDPKLETRPQKRTRGVANPKMEVFEPKKRGYKKKNLNATSQPLEPAVASPPPPPPQLAPMPPLVPAAPPPMGGLKAPVIYFPSPHNPPLAPAPGPHAHGPFMHTFNAGPAFRSGSIPPVSAAPPAVKKPITKIKFTNGSSSQPTSRAATPGINAPAANAKPTAKGQRGSKAGLPEARNSAPSSISGDMPDKPYAAMSKSEKMSHSMKRRWASGQMQSAVEKRRTTLANKKAEKVTPGPGFGGTEPNAVGYMTDPGSAGASAPTTPGLAPSQPGALAFPPQLPPPHMQSLQQPQHLQHPQPLAYPAPRPPGPVA